MPGKSKVKINGLEFASISSACKHYKIGRDTVNSRVNRHGWSIERALTEPKNKPAAVIIKNKVFNSINDAANYYQINPETVYYRLNKGWSLEEAVELVKRSDTSNCEGIIYRISNSVNSKIYIGLTTLSLDKRFAQHKRNASQGKRTKLCRALRKYGSANFNIEAIEFISCRYKLPKREAYYIKKYDSIKTGYNTTAGGGGTGDRHGYGIKFEGREFISQSALARHLGMNIKTLQERLSRNLPLDIKIGKGGTTGTKILYRGKVYKSIKELGVHVGLSKTAIHYRINNNYCLNGKTTDKGKGFYKAIII